MKNEYYKVDDNCDTPLIYDDLQAAMDAIRDLLDGIDYDYPITIKRVKMTKEKFEALLEL